MSLKNKIESLLFISHKPLAVKELAKIIGEKTEDIMASVVELEKDYQGAGRGIKLLKVEDKYQLATDGESAEVVDRFVKGEMTGELTKPSLEALTVIAYRGPISKAELELIRGVNCSLILRNLLIRGLIEAEESKLHNTVVYKITHDFLKYLGLSRVEELADFEKLNRNQNLDKLIKADADKV